MPVRELLGNICQAAEISLHDNTPYVNSIQDVCPISIKFYQLYLILLSPDCRFHDNNFETEDFYGK